MKKPENAKIALAVLRAGLTTLLYEWRQGLIPTYKMTPRLEELLKGRPTEDESE